MGGQPVHESALYSVLYLSVEDQAKIDHKRGAALVAQCHFPAGMLSTLCTTWSANQQWADTMSPFPTCFTCGLLQCKLLFVHPTTLHKSTQGCLSMICRIYTALTTRVAA
jgi:hypothetical protein